LVYVVTLAEHQLSTDLHVENTSKTESLEFQALLHNYFRVPADEVTVTPLNGLSYYDKTETTKEARSSPKTESRDEVTVTKRTDSVYENGPQKYRVAWPGGCIDIRVKNFKDVVVWNPQEEGRQIGDMEPDGWYVCHLFSNGQKNSFRNLGRSIFALSLDSLEGSCRSKQDRLGLASRFFPSLVINQSVELLKAL